MTTLLSSAPGSRDVGSDTGAGGDSGGGDWTRTFFPPFFRESARRSVIFDAGGKDWGGSGAVGSGTCVSSEGLAPGAI